MFSNIKVLLKSTGKMTVRAEEFRRRIFLLEVKALLKNV